MKPPAQLVREARGITLQQMARRVGYTPKTLRHFELHGCRQYDVARRLAWLYGCNIMAFEPTWKGGLRTTPTAAAEATPDAVPVRRSRRYRPPAPPVLTLAEEQK